MTSWRPLVAGTLGLFLVILAFLAGQLRAGGDPALSRSATPATEAATPEATPAPQEEFGAGPEGSGGAEGALPYAGELGLFR